MRSDLVCKEEGYGTPKQNIVIVKRYREKRVFSVFSQLETVGGIIPNNFTTCVLYESHQNRTASVV